MPGIHVSIVSPKHVYTRSSTPWRHDEDVVVTTRSSAENRLFRFLSGGGLRAFGRSVRQEERSARQTRFLVAAGLIACAWLVMWAV